MLMIDFMEDMIKTETKGFASDIVFNGAEASDSEYDLSGLKPSIPWSRQALPPS